MTLNHEIHRLNIKHTEVAETLLTESSICNFIISMKHLHLIWGLRLVCPFGVFVAVFCLFILKLHSLFSKPSNTNVWFSRPPLQTCFFRSNECQSIVWAWPLMKGQNVRLSWVRVKNTVNMLWYLASMWNQSKMSSTQGDVYPFYFLRNNCEFYFGFHFIKLSGVLEENYLQQDKLHPI